MKPSKKSTGMFPQCIWMQAGVVVKKECKLKFNCRSCRFDIVMLKIANENKRLRERGLIPSGKRGKIRSWREALMERPLWKRPCIHYMKGRIKSFRICTNDYKCANCEFDQYFSDQYTVYTVVTPVDYIEFRGFKIPQGYYLYYGHSWVKIEEGKMVRIGLDDFILRLLGPFDQVKLPFIGKKIEQGKTNIELYKRKRLAKVLSPISGVISAINLEVMKDGTLMNNDPYSKGWLLRVYCDNLQYELKELMIGQESHNFLKKEVNQLYNLIEETIGPLSIDGGYLDKYIYDKLPRLGWRRLKKIFLRT